LQHCNKIPLAISSTIRSFLAGFLLVIFAIGITPKRTLHNIVANHTDGKAGTINLQLPGEQLSTSSFNCQCDNLIVESPFVAETYQYNIPFHYTFAAFTAKQVSGHYSSDRFSFCLRGPPAC
jgi:hypothetical protein